MVFSFSYYTKCISSAGIGKIEERLDTLGLSKNGHSLKLFNLNTINVIRALNILHKK